MSSKCKPKLLTLLKLLYQVSTVERQYLIVLQAITEAFLQMTFMVPQETSYQGRGGQKGKSDVSQDSLQCFQTRAELRGNSADLEIYLGNTQGAHTGLEQKFGSDHKKLCKLRAVAEKMWCCQLQKSYVHRL